MRLDSETLQCEQCKAALSFRSGQDDTVTSVNVPEEARVVNCRYQALALVSICTVPDADDGDAWEARQNAPLRGFLGLAPLKNRPWDVIF